MAIERKVVYGRSNPVFPLVPVGSYVPVAVPAPLPKIQLSRKAAAPGK